LRFTRWGLFIALFLVACSPTIFPSRILVEWKTASELDTAGFNLFRGESPDGPFIQLNDAIISASPDPVIGGAYRYEDTGVFAGKTYYYQLEDVELNGTRTRHGPISIAAPFTFSDNSTVWIFVFALGGLGAVGLTFFFRRRLLRF
jgi:hypothetical protein